MDTHFWGISFFQVRIIKRLRHIFAIEGFPLIPGVSFGCLSLDRELKLQSLQQSLFFVLNGMCFLLSCGSLAHQTTEICSIAMI